MKVWKRYVAVLATGAIFVAPIAIPSALASANTITVAETTQGGVGVNQVPDPWVNSGSISESVMFRGLLRAKPDLTTVQPDLASAYTTSKDGLTFTFTLKPNLKWSDGQALTADDVVWSMNELLHVSQANALYVNTFKQIVGASAVSASNTANITGITANGNTITVVLTKPVAAFLPVMAQFMILPKHSLSTADPLKLATNDFWKAPVTSGPFKVGTFSQGNFITLVQNPNYEGTKPAITTINVVTSANLAGDAAAGKIDYFTTNDVDTINKMKTNPGFKGYPINIAYYRYFVFNLTEANNPFSNVLSRQALEYGIDWNSLVRVLYPQLGTVINSGVPSNFPFHQPSIAHYTYDPVKAKALLTQAKFDFTKTVRLRYYYADQTSINLMTAVSQQLQKLGIKVDVLKFQGDATTELYTNKNYDVALKGLSAFGVNEWYAEYSDAPTFGQLLGPQPQFDALNAQLSTSVTTRQKMTTLYALQALEQSTLLKLPLYSLMQYVFVSNRLNTGITKYGNPLYLYDNNFAAWAAN